MSGYQCRNCGYEPDRDEANAGLCPQCFVWRLEDELCVLQSQRDAVNLSEGEYVAAYDEKIAKLNRMIDNFYARMH